MNWTITQLPEVEHDLAKLTPTLQRQAVAAIHKVAQNPLPRQEGGYGKPLGHHRNTDLSGLCKIKLKKSGIRVVYKAIRRDNTMLIIVIGIRADEQVYREANSRRNRYDI